MRKDLDEKLCEKFPLLYADRKASMRTTCMCWGFSCGDGWFELIWDLSSKLEPLIEQWITENPEHKDSHPRASQVKEKFGSLRFYMSCGTDEMYNLISEAESKSYQTCESCGKEGKLRRGGWISVLCDDHAGERAPFDEEVFDEEESEDEVEEDGN